MEKVMEAVKDLFDKIENRLVSIESRLDRIEAKQSEEKEILEGILRNTEK